MESLISLNKQTDKHSRKTFNLTFTHHERKLCMEQEADSDIFRARGVPNITNICNSNVA